MVRPTTVNATGEKYVPLKSSGNEKIWVSACSTAKAIRTKMKPFVAFKSAKQKAAVKKNFRHSCEVASSSNGWMNEELT